MSTRMLGLLRGHLISWLNWWLSVTAPRNKHQHYPRLINDAHFLIISATFGAFDTVPGSIKGSKEHKYLIPG